MTRTKGTIIGIALTLVVAGAYYVFCVQGSQKTPGPALSPEEQFNAAVENQEVQEAVKKAGERAYKKAYLAPMIATYEKLLAKIPDNVDLQKKLVAAYLEVGATDKARPLLEKLAKSRDPDAATYQEQLDTLK